MLVITVRGGCNVPLVEWRWLFGYCSWDGCVLRWVERSNKAIRILILKTNIRTCSNGYKLDRIRFSKETGRDWYKERVEEVEKKKLADR